MSLVHYVADHYRAPLCGRDRLEVSCTGYLCYVTCKVCLKAVVRDSVKARVVRLSFENKRITPKVVASIKRAVERTLRDIQKGLLDV